MNYKRKAEIWAEIDFAYGQLSSARSTARRGNFGISSGYIRGAKQWIRKIERMMK